MTVIMKYYSAHGLVSSVNSVEKYNSRLETSVKFGVKLQGLDTATTFTYYDIYVLLILRTPPVTYSIFYLLLHLRSPSAC